jgi:beta-lactamase superfamily II metal-dependent hydrolase
LTPPYLAILDVGHGSCAVLVETDRVIIIDAGSRGSTLRDFLIQQEIHRIDAVLLSHADEDHIGGILRILAKPEFTVAAVYANPAPGRDTVVWDDLLSVLREYRRKGTDILAGSVDTNLTGRLDSRVSRIECLAPGAVDVLAQHLQGQPRGHVADTNTMSAVIRVWALGNPVALFMGDLDGAGLQVILAAGTDLWTPLLVFPHHGGMAGSGAGQSATVAFAERLCEEVKPSTVVFSIGRDRFTNPLPAVVDAVRRKCPEAWIACTQLSRNCQATPIRHDMPHLTPAFARGHAEGVCCAGSLVVSITSAGSQVIPVREEHQKFVHGQVETPLCRPVAISVSATPTDARPRR